MYVYAYYILHWEFYSIESDLKFASLNVHNNSVSKVSYPFYRQENFAPK